MSTPRYLAIARIHLPISNRFLVVTTALITLALVLAIASLLLGTSDVKLASVARWLLGPIGDADQDTAELMQLRAPRVAVALLCGAMMATSGYLLQVISGNGLTDPGLIGISHGSGAAILLGSVVFGVSPDSLPVLGLAGGLTTATVVLGLAAWLRASNGLILIGLAVGITLGALVEIVMVSGGIGQFARYVTWSHGSLTAAAAPDVLRLCLWGAALSLPLLVYTRVLGPLSLGADQAASLGVPPVAHLALFAFVAAALVAPVVAVAGPISFLGLIAAHLGRRLVGDRPGEAMVVTALSGGVLLLVADVAGRTLFLPMVLPAGLIVSVVGVISFLAVAASKRRAAT